MCIKLIILDVNKSMKDQIEIYFRAFSDFLGNPTILHISSNSEKHFRRMVEIHSDFLFRFFSRRNGGKIRLKSK